MPSNPTTPQPKQNGNGLQDPFTEEKQEDSRTSSGDGRKEDKGDDHQGVDGEESKKETPSLFYAYARRSDNNWASRYLLTFSSAQVCNDWWSLIENHYPNQALRYGPQFFSFVGDDFPKKPAQNPKFEHLKTKWFYTQFGDSSRTDGRAQNIIPLQDWDGRIIRGGGGDDEAEPHKAPQPDKKGKGKAIEEDEASGDDRNHSRIDFSALATSLQTAASIAETTNAQVSQLAESQYRDQDAIQQSQERLQRMEALVEENAAQLQALSKSHVRAQQQNRELAEQNARMLREMKRQRVQTQGLLERVVESGAGGGGGGGGGREKEQGEIEGMHVVVHPPPRKIDRVMVGYAYQLEGGGEAAKRSPVKRPAVRGRTTSAVTGPKGGGGK